jgi:lysophospholipase L1-like esterase
MSLGRSRSARTLLSSAKSRFRRAKSTLPHRPGSLRRGPRGRTLSVESLERREVLSGVVTIGDSWAWLIAAGAPGSAPPAPGFSNSLGNAISTFFPGVPVYNESFGGGTAAQHVAQIGDIINRINAHPDADIVWLSSGGNDLLLGALGGGFYVGNPNNAAVYSAIQSNVQTIVNSILAIRPDIQVVIEGYDYLNVWDTVTGSAGDTIRANLGIIKSGNTFIDAQQNLALNDGFKAAEAGKIAIANASSRVAHITNWGLMNTTNGYSGYFGTFAGTGSTYPPELYPYLPTRASLMNTTDPIHLNSAGYNILSSYAVQQYFSTALQSATLSLNDTDLAYGQVRVGTSASQSVTASNVGPNYTKVKNLTFSVATGPFSGGGQSFNPLFKDPSLGSDTASINYAFAPTTRGTVNQITSATSSSNNQNMLLSGTGVGPVFTSVPSVTLNPVTAGTVVAQNVNVLNSTSDGDLGALTNLSLVSAAIIGPDASRFSLTNFTPGSVIAAGGIQGNILQFSAVGATSGSYNATLTFTTDVGAAFGAAGTQYSIPLTAIVVAVPPVVNAGGPYNTTEASTVLLSALGAGEISAYAWDLDNNGSYETSGQSVNFSQPDNGVFTVGVQATGPGGTATATTTVTVGNVAPTAGVAGPSSLLRDAAQNFTLSANDVSSIDQAAGFSYSIDWNGDGSDVEVVNGPSGTIVAHTFNTVGARTVKVTATDKDGGPSTQATLSVSVSAAQLVDNGGQFDLVWTGTAGADHVQFEQLSPTSVRVTTTLENGLATNVVETFSGVTGRVDVQGKAGDDTLDAEALATIAATLDGGTGNNTLYGGGANDILIGGANFGANVNGPEGQQGSNIVVGGAGDDIIYGNSINGAEGRGGNNILLGGAGNDTLYGNWINGGEGGGRNILVGGADSDTLYDYQIADGAEGRGSILIADDTSLSQADLGAVLSEWASTRSYTTRVENILGIGTGDRNNGNVFLQVPGTVTADSSADTLWGTTGGGFNWFWYVLALDSLNRAKAGETLSTI